MPRLLKAVEHGLQATEFGHPFAVIDAAAQSILHSLGLLENLLEHEMGERAALRRF